MEIKLQLQKSTLHSRIIYHLVHAANLVSYSCLTGQNFELLLLEGHCRDGSLGQPQGNTGGWSSHLGGRALGDCSGAGRRKRDNKNNDLNRHFS